MFTSNPLSRLKSVFFCLALLAFPLCTNAQDLEDGSALDSMEDLIGDLSDDELASAIAEEKEPEPSQEPEPEPQAAAEEMSTAVKPVANADVQATAQPEASAKPSSAVKPNPGKPNALLVLTADRKAKVWVNGRYRGRVSPKKRRRFPVRAGRVVVTAKGDNGQTRRIVKKIKAKSRLKAHIRLSKGAKRAARRAIKRAARKGAIKGARKAARKAGKRAQKRAKKGKRGTK